MKNLNTALKNKRSRYLAISVLLIFALLVTPACFVTDIFNNIFNGVTETGVQVSEGVDPNLYNQANAMYMKTVGSFASCYGELSIEMARQDKQTKLLNDFMQSNVDLAKAYRDPLAQYGANKEKAATANTDPNSSGDLSKLLANGGTPAQMGLTLALTANVFTEAQMVLPDSKVAQNAQWSIDESFSNMKVILRDCNTAATDYNTFMSPIPAQTMQAIAEKLGKGVPKSLPLLTLSYDAKTGLLDPGLVYPGEKPVKDPFYIPGLNDK